MQVKIILTPKQTTTKNTPKTAQSQSFNYHRSENILHEFLLEYGNFLNEQPPTLIIDFIRFIFYIATCGRTMTYVNGQECVA